MPEQQQEKPKDLYEYLQRLSIRPQMYIGSKSLKDLQTHISGFKAAEWIHGIDRFNSVFGEFHDFVAHQYRFSSSGKGWPTMIMEKNNGNEDLALEDFFRLLDLFVHEKGRI